MMKLILVALSIFTFTAFAAKPLQTLKYPDRTMGYFQLANGLDVLLVSSPGYQKDSVSMAVPVGALSDPLEHQGMAHFLEHMLFLSTRDFPVGDYEKYLSNNGGSNNALTGLESTRYFFDVNSSALDGALKRFSQFFVSPQFNAEYIEREKNAVNNEFQSYIQDEGRRLWGSISWTAPKGHPYNRFMVGSTETLKNAKRKDMIEFYEKYYSSNTMKLVMMSSRPIAELKKLAEKHFSAVPNRKLTKPNYRQGRSPVARGEWLNVKAVTDSKSLILSFVTPPVSKAWRTKPHKFLTAVLGHEGAGSVVAKLKNENLIEKQEVSESDSSGEGDFTIEYDLTAEGAKRVDYILEQTFAHINLLRKEGVPAHIFDEVKLLTAQKFENRMLVEGGEAIAGISDHFLRHDGSPLTIEKDLEVSFGQPSAAEMKSWLASLRPDNAQIIFHAPNVPTDKVEKYFGVEYSQRPMTKDELTRFASATNASLHLPEPNRYVARDFKLIKESSSSAPRKAIDEEAGVLWLAQESRAMATARGYVQVEFINPLAAKSARENLLAAMLAEAIELEQNEALFPAMHAGYKLDLQASPIGIVGIIAGYSEGVLKAAYDFLTYKGKSLAETPLDDSRFASLKASARAKITNRKQENAYKIVIDRFKYLVLSPGFLIEDAEVELEALTAEDLRAFAKEFFATGYFETLVYGNIKEQDARDFYDNLKRTTGAKPATRESLDLVRDRVQRPSSGQTPAVLLQGQNANNAFISAYITGEGTMKDEITTALIAKIFESPFFTELRSNQQLGYIVTSFAYNRPGIAALILLIQSSEYESAELARRSHIFAADYSKKLAQISAEEFAKVKAAKLEELRQESPNMDEEFKDLQDRLSKNADFKRLEKSIAALEKLTAEEFRAHVAQLFDPKQRGRLSLYYNGKNQPAPKGLPDDRIIPEKIDP